MPFGETYHAGPRGRIVPVLFFVRPSSANSALGDERDSDDSVGLVQEAADGKAHSGHGKWREGAVSGGVVGPDRLDQREAAFLKKVRMGPDAGPAEPRLVQATKGQMNEG